MTDFEVFSSKVHAQFTEMSKDELYTVDISGDTLYELYLSAFPEGTNPIYKERTEHDCSCCKNFIRNIGLVVSIQNNELVTVWDVVDVPFPYDVVAKFSRIVFVPPRSPVCFVVVNHNMVLK